MEQGNDTISRSFVLHIFFVVCVEKYLLWKHQNFLQTKQLANLSLVLINLSFNSVSVSLVVIPVINTRLNLIEKKLTLTLVGYLQTKTFINNIDVLVVPLWRYMKRLDPNW